MIPKQLQDKIKDAARVEEVLGDFISLKKKGASLWACCPFHGEKTPSFSVNPARGFYHCFGCHKGGNSVTFLMEHEGMSYTEALKYIANKYHIEVIEREETAQEIQQRTREESLLLVMDFAAKFYNAQLKEGEGRTYGYSYCQSRRLEDKTIEEYMLGWSPSSKTAFTQAAKAAGYKDEYLIDANLCVQNQDGSLRDRFYERLMFPIFSPSGRVIAFSARTLRSDFKEAHIGKYVNSAETDIYKKKNTLFGLHLAKSQIHRLDQCILVEGNVDAISMHQHGITNVVATCGTALTSEQVRLIKRFSDNVTIIYDGDKAGIKAALRGTDIFLEEGMNVRIVVLPDGKDPDDFCKENSLEQVNEYLAANARDFVSFKAEQLLGGAQNDPLEKANVINEIADTISLVPDEVKRVTFAGALAERFDISREVLARRITATRRARAEKDSARPSGYDSQVPPPVPPVEDPQSQDSLAPLDIPGAKGVKILRPKPSRLRPSEESLLDFLLNSGKETLVFPKDSPYFSAEPITVAEFIDSALAADDIIFSQEDLRTVYDSYFEFYDQGFSQDDIVRHIASSGDSQVVSLIAQMTSKRYEVTVATLRASMTSESTILVQEVPKAILLYHVKLMEEELESVRKQLKGASGEEMLKMMGRINTINQNKKKINKQLGRI